MSTPTSPICQRSTPNPSTRLTRREHPLARIHDAVQAYLDRRGWPYEDRGQSVVSSVVGQSGTWVAYFELREDEEELLIYSLLPLTVPEDERTAVALYLTRANFGWAIGNFEMDLDSGHVRYKTSIDVEGAVLEEQVIDHLLLANIVAVDHHLPVLQSMVEGGHAATASSALDGRPSRSEKDAGDDDPERRAVARWRGVGGGG